VEGLDEEGPSRTTRQAETVVAARDYALIPYVPPVQRGEPLSQFEKMLLRRFHNILGNQKMHHEYCTARFQLLHQEIKQVRDQLNSMGFINDVVCLCIKSIA